MSIHKLEVYYAEDIRQEILETRHRLDISEHEKALVTSLIDDYQLWFEDIDSAESRSKPYGKWTEGEPAWILATDHNGAILAYISLILANRQYMGFGSGKVLDVYISEEQNILDTIPSLRSAADDLLWFHQSQRMS